MIFCGSVCFFSLLRCIIDFQFCYGNNMLSVYSCSQIPSGFNVSSECRDLVLRLLTRDPADRISFEDFFAHPFLELDKVPSEHSLSKAVR